MIEQNNLPSASSGGGRGEEVADVHTNVQATEARASGGLPEVSW